MTDAAVPSQVLARYGLADATLDPITVGLVNRTYAVCTATGERYILQRLHPIFAASVNDDLDVITTHVAARGLPTPRLVRTTDGAPCIEHEGVYRVLTYLEGRVFHTVNDASLAHAGGHLAGRFHDALRDLDHEFAFTRPGPHDTPRHMGNLRAALERHTDVAVHARALSLSRAIFEHFESLGALPATRRRIIHGDLKITNLLFEPETDRGLALLDLDTMQWSTYPIELGDALRSWCNPLGESARDAHCDVVVAKAAIEGWVEGIRGALDDDELALVPRAAATIAVELASRFATDALEDRFFGWDASKYASRAEHNLVRAESQLALSRDVVRRMGDLRAAVRAIR